MPSNTPVAWEQFVGQLCSIFKAGLSEELCPAYKRGLFVPLPPRAAKFLIHSNMLRSIMETLSESIQVEGWRAENGSCWRLRFVHTSKGVSIPRNKLSLTALQTLMCALDPGLG